MRGRARRASIRPSHTAPPDRDAAEAVEATFRQHRHDY